MSDETFGPEKRKTINTSEFQTQGETDQNDNSYISKPKFKGQLPPELEARLNNSNDGDESPMKVTEGSRMQQKVKPRSEEPKLRVTGSSKLEELLEGIKENTSTYEKITLPSLGKFYDGEDGPIDGIIHIRPMTGEEESILATPRFVKRGDAVNMIFNKCMREKYKAENFLSADRTFLLIWLRGISYGPSYEVELTCPFTDKKFSYTIDLNLDVNLCPDNFSQSSLQETLPTLGYSFTYRLSRGKDELAIQAHRDRKAKFDNSMQIDDSLIFRTSQLVEEIEGLSDKIELAEILKKLPVSDGNYIRNLVNDPPFGAVTKVTVNSPFTLEDFEVDLPLDSNFFFPRRQKTE